jgi:hypothetical protein
MCKSSKRFVTQTGGDGRKRKQKVPYRTLTGLTGDSYYSKTAVSKESTSD